VGNWIDIHGSLQIKARKKCALLLPVPIGTHRDFYGPHLSDLDYPFKRLIVFPQSVRWENIKDVYGRSLRLGSFLTGITGGRTSKTLCISVEQWLYHIHLLTQEEIPNAIRHAV